MMTDCLLIGFNDSDFNQYVEMVRAMGEDSGAFRDLNLAYITHEGHHYRALDILSHFQPAYSADFYHNTDFLWPTITCLGSYLHQRGFTFDYVNVFQLEKEQLKQKLLNDDILTIAITTTLYVSAHPILEIIDFIRQYNTTAKIIVGGPHISNKVQSDADLIEVRDVFDYIGADLYVFSREGEYALYQILQALKGHGRLADVDNIAYLDGDDYEITRYSIESNSLEENMVDYTLFPQADLGEFVSLRTAKSCPFSCSFCSFPTRAGKYTYLDVALVEQELNALRDLGTVSTLTFLDDTFNVPKKRFQEILRMMIRNAYGFKWNSYYRSDHGDAETIALMQEAGCEGVFLGVESGSDEILEKMRKTARRKHYLDAIPRLRNAGIITHCNLIIGFPGETLTTVQETIDFLEIAQPDFYRAQLWYADPVTPIWQKREEYGIEGSAFSWRHNTMDSATAIELVDRLFLDVQNSLWLPQWGFELWSVFYLQRKGMTRGQIKQFVLSFNAVIRDKLLHGDGRTIPAHLLHELEQSCQFTPVRTQELVLA
ncbi:MAG: PhpK family radical SAM P-methyltransferase [Caldilineaceae bacterium]